MPTRPRIHTYASFDLSYGHVTQLLSRLGIHGLREGQRVREPPVRKSNEIPLHRRRQGEGVRVHTIEEKLRLPRGIEQEFGALPSGEVKSRLSCHGDV